MHLTAIKSVGFALPKFFLEQPAADVTMPDNDAHV